MSTIRRRSWAIAGLCALLGPGLAAAHAAPTWTETAGIAEHAAAAAGDCSLASVDGSEQKARSHKWWSSEEGRVEFGLSDQQSRDLEAIFQQMQADLRKNKVDVDTYRRELTKLLSEASAKESVVVKAIDQLEAAQSALSRTRTIMLYRMYRLLRPDQRVKVQAYYERRAKESGDQSARR